MRKIFTLLFCVMLVLSSSAQFVAPVGENMKASKTPANNGVILEQNLIRNGNFDDIKSDGSPDLWGGWIDDGWGAPWTVVDGAVAITTLQENVDEQWHIQFNQTDLGAYEDIPYTLSFVAWGSEERAATVDFEDTEANGYNRYGISTDPEAVTVGSGSSEWHFNVTTEPSRFTFHVTFDRMVSTTVQKIQFMLSQDLGTIYLDSITLVADDVEIIDVDTINLTGGTITTDNGTLQIVAEIIPEDATNKNLKWSVAPADGSTGRAKISNTGLLTAILDGKVTVTAMSSDEFIISTVDVEISGQVVTEDDINVIKNGNMDMVESDGRATYWTGSWTDESPAHTIVDGISVHTPIVSETDPQFWRYQFTQNNLNALPDEPYIFKFKAWADAERSIITDFEDTGANGNNRYGSTTDPRSSTGRSEWSLNLTTEPTWYIFDVIFDEIVESTDQKVAFFMGLSNVTTYIDSVYLISEADMGLVPVIVNTLQSFKVYPNPASSKLHVEFSTPNATVSIYNSLGIKMDEEVVYGTHHMFDVSRYAKGLYFVKANGSVVKFVK